MKTQNIYSIIFNNLRRTFLFYLGLTIILLMIISYYINIGIKEFIIIPGAEFFIYFFLIHNLKKVITLIIDHLEFQISLINNISHHASKPSNILEVDKLSRSIQHFLNKIANQEDHIANINFNNGQIKMAKEVAHNLKGAIAFLQLKLSTLPDLSFSDKQEFAECMNSIRDVSTNLLKSNEKSNRDEVANNFINEIKITDGSTLLVIDNDKLIHEIWRSKFKRIGLKISQVHHFFTPEDFNIWMNENGHGNYGSRHYFFDYDLQNDFFTGLDLIEHHGLGLESILISGLADDQEIYARAKRLGVASLPKDLLNSTAIVKISI